MKLRIFITGVIIGLPSMLIGEECHDLRPTPPSNIIGILENFVFPEISIKDFPLGESLLFIYTKYAHLEVDPPQDDKFLIEVRLAKAIIERRVTVEAKSITMIDAMDAVLRGTSHSFIIEPGKLIITEPPKS